MWGIIPAAGAGTRIQPLAFSKELLPVGSRLEGGIERPKAVSEYLIERLVAGGADRICFVISPGKSDIMEYFGGCVAGADVCYAVQPEPRGLCDAIFSALPFLPAGEHILVGLPDTVWFPADGLARLPREHLAFLLFPVERPEFFDAVVTDPGGDVALIQVKEENPATHWIWGAFGLPVGELHALHALWLERKRRDQYIGSLVNAWLAVGGRATGVRAGEAYVDVGTLHGYREAIQVLTRRGAVADPELLSRTAAPGEVSAASAGTAPAAPAYDVPPPRGAPPRTTPPAPQRSFSSFTPRGPRPPRKLPS